MSKITLQDIRRKGFSILRGKWMGDRFQTVIGVRPVSRNTDHTIGYLAYPNTGDLKNTIPDRQFFHYDQLIIQNDLPVVVAYYKTSGRLRQSVTKDQYIKKIKRIKELLAAGEVYQINFAIRFQKKFIGDPYALFLKLSEVNPVDFQAYLNCGNFQIISSSPERFFKAEKGKIITQPIKGTIAKESGVRNQESAESRFLTPDSCPKDINLAKLLKSEKERAELDMITDLERNDVGRICEYGTLKLKKERAVLELPNLWHCYSEVEGKLCPEVGPEEVISALFPGGSITGCPKKRAMEYISALEGLPRNVYTGSIGYIMTNDQCPMSNKRNKKSQITNLPVRQAGHKSKMDFNIAIRTILIKDGIMEFWAGGGIVADSDPEKEYEECLLKAEKFLAIL